VDGQAPVKAKTAAEGEAKSAAQDVAKPQETGTKTMADIIEI